MCLLADNCTRVMSGDLISILILKHVKCKSRCLRRKCSYNYVLQMHIIGPRHAFNLAVYFLEHLTDIIKLVLSLIMNLDLKCIIILYQYRLINTIGIYQA